MLVVDLEVVRENYAKFARALPDTPRLLCREGEPGAEAPGPPGAPRILLRHRVGGRDPDGALGRRHGGPHLVRQHDQEGARHRPGAGARRAPLRGRLRGRGGEDRPGPRRHGGPRTCASSAASCATAPERSGRCRASSAACPTWRSGSWSTPTGQGCAPTGCRSTSARSSRTRRPGTARSRPPRGSSASWRSAASSSRWSISAGASRRST